MARKRCAICKRKVKAVRVFFGVASAPTTEGVCQDCRLRLRIGEYADPPKPAGS